MYVSPVPCFCTCEKAPFSADVCCTVILGRLLFCATIRFLKSPSYDWICALGIRRLTIPDDLQAVTPHGTSWLHLEISHS